MVVDVTSEQEGTVDAVGFNIEGSASVGGGMHGGTGFVYFLTGDDKGSLFNYDFLGANVGVGAGAGISAFISDFNSEEAPDSFHSVNGFGGGYNGYSASYGVGGTSYSWSNVNNSTDELYPGMRSAWTWKTKSLGAGSGAGKFEVKYFGGNSSNFGEIETKN